LPYHWCSYCSNRLFWTLPIGSLLNMKENKSDGTFSYSARNRMYEQKSDLKVGDDILYSSDNMIGSGTVFRIEEKKIVVQTGNGARGLEYINKSQIVKRYG